MKLKQDENVEDEEEDEENNNDTTADVSDTVAEELVSRVFIYIYYI